VSEPLPPPFSGAAQPDRPEPPVADAGPAPAFDLGSWKQALSQFGSNPEIKVPEDVKAMLQEGGPDREGEAPVAVLDQLRLEWSRFLDHLSKKGLQVLVSHLHVSELVSCSPRGVVELGCCRKFSFEELQHDTALLEGELIDYYRLPLKLVVRYDAARDACTKEKSIFTMFQELSETNEVVRCIIRDFGGELVY
jgi:DNA polymerase-3 subunit gamma/tau